MELLAPNGLTLVVAHAGAPGLLVGTPDPVTPAGVAMLVEPDDVVIEEPPDAGEKVLLLGIEIPELIDDEIDDVGADCGRSIEIPVGPSTDPVWTLAIGLQAIDVVLVGPGV